MRCFTAFDQMFVEVQILSNTPGQTKGKCLITKQCLIVFRRQTFPVSTELNVGHTVEPPASDHPKCQA